MFTTVDQVEELTSYVVTPGDIVRAQAIIESYINRMETDIVAPRDTALLARATAYQAAYMVDNKETVFQQVDVSSMGQFGQIITFRSGDMASPYIAPLAVHACRGLSWKRIRSVKTGSIFGAPPVTISWRTD